MACNDGVRLIQFNQSINQSINHILPLKFKVNNSDKQYNASRTAKLKSTI